jgi:hypothetical protein
MKRTFIVILAVALLLTMFCGVALASHGDVTVKSAKVYADSALKQYVGTIPAYTALVVRSNDSYTDIYYNGNVYYINSSALLNKSVLGKYAAILKAGTKVYQQPAGDANTYKLKKSGVVQICKVKGDWALVQTMGERGLYAFVKVNALSNITEF